MRQNEYGGAKAEFKKLERVLSQRNIYKFEELLNFFHNTIVYRYLKPLILPLLEDCIELYKKQAKFTDQHCIFDKKISKETLPFAIKCLEYMKQLQESLTHLNTFSIANRNYKYHSSKVNILFKYYLTYSLESTSAKIYELTEEMEELGWKDPKSSQNKRKAAPFSSTDKKSQTYPKQSSYPNNILSAFKTLDIPPTEDPQYIKTAWKDLFTIWHPDKHSSENQRRRNKADENQKRSIKLMIF